MKRYGSSLPAICCLVTFFGLGWVVQFLLPHGWEAIKILAFTGVAFLTAIVGWWVSGEVKD